MKPLSKSAGPRYNYNIRNGYVFVGSDLHVWPDQRPTAWRAFVKLAGLLKPKGLILNGDVIDGTSISRHPRIGWEYRPTVQDEIEAAQGLLSEVEGSDAELLWTLGNHDARFELALAAKNPEYERVKGIHLKDHFPEWRPAYSVVINGKTIVKHNWKGGVHAAYNNAKDSGFSTVTGHTHRLGAIAYRDYTGTRWGMESGMLAAVVSPQFLYTSDNPLNWNSGFLMLRYEHGELQWPEIVYVADEKKGRVVYNGKTLYV